jgi:glucose/arabinose dehydrogenase
MVKPVANSGPNETWAPASLAFVDGRLFFGGLRGESLYVATPDPSAPAVGAYFRGVYGRIRAAAVSPDGQLYITTSNTDGRGTVRPGDDKLIRINPARLPKR